MEFVKATLQSLAFHWVSLFPTVLRRIFQLICVGFPPLEKSPGGFQFRLHVPFRIRFPKPPWNHFYIKFLTVIAFLCLNEVTTISDNIWHQSGFFDFAIEIESLHRHRVKDPDVPFLKSGKDFPFQIWDPGILNFGIEDNDIQLQIITSHSIFTSMFQILFLSPEFPVHRYIRSMFKDLRLAKKREVTVHPMIPEMHTNQHSGFINCGYYVIRILRLLFNYWRDSFNKSWQDQKEWVMIAETYGHLLVVDISKCLLFVSAFQNQRKVNGIRSRQWILKSSSTLWYSFSRCEVIPLLFWSLIEWAITEDEDRTRIILKKYKRLNNNNGLGLRDDFLFLRLQCNGGDVLTVSRSVYLGSMERETRVTNMQLWMGYYITHDPDTFQATHQCFCVIRVMRKAFGSFIYKMLALYKYMKRGLNRFYLLPVRLLLESRVTSTSSSKLSFNFLYLFQWLYLNCFRYHVKLL